MTRVVDIRWIALLALSSGCLHDLHGVRSASRKGDTSHLAARLAPNELADVTSACQLEPTIDESSLLRRPYLQRVTTNDAYVVWTASKNVDGVALFRPDGASVGTFATTVDASAHQPFGQQMYAHATGLQPDTIYCYSIVENGKAITNRAGFRTPPLPDAHKPTRFLVWGDSGGASDDQRAVAAQMETVRADLALVVGDVAYEEGTLEQFERTYFDIYRKLERRIPIYPESGNHDYETNKGAPFRQVFMLPDNGGPRGLEKWWSFDWGDVHFVALDTQDLADEQTRFLDADLAASHAKWKVVYLHRPPFSSGHHGVQADVRDRFVPIFEKHHVSLVLGGHDHDYERMKPQNGVTYFVSGGGGRSTRTVSSSPMTALSLNVLHFLYVEADDAHMVVHAIDATGVEFDAAVIDPS